MNFSPSQFFWVGLSRTSDSIDSSETNEVMSGSRWTRGSDRH